MAFITRKKVKGKHYYQLVENKRVNGKVVQRVIKHIGSEKYFSSIPKELLGVKKKWSRKK